MINVVLDTNILYKEGLSSVPMLKLHRLVLSEHVRVFVPELVKMEFLNKKISESGTRLLSAKDSLKEILSKKTLLGRDIHSEISTVQNSLEQLMETIEGELRLDFDKWVHKYNVEIVPIPNDCTLDVMKDYFAGKNAFRKPQNKDDFPDSFIEKTINSIHANVGELTAILNDGILNKHFVRAGKLPIANSLDSFLSEQRNVDKFTELDANMILFRVNGLAREFFGSEEFQRLFLENLHTESEFIEDIFLDEANVAVTDAGGLDIFGESISGFDNITNLEITEVELLDQNEYSFDFTCDAEAGMSYCAEYQSAQELLDEPDLDVETHSMNGEGIHDLSQSVSVKIYGTSIIRIEGEMDIEKIKRDSRTLHVIDNPITVTFDFHDVEVDMFK